MFGTAGRRMDGKKEQIEETQWIDSGRIEGERRGTGLQGQERNKTFTNRGAERRGEKQRDGILRKDGYKVEKHG